MVRRVAALIVASGLALGAYAMTAPGAPTSPDFGTTQPPQPDGATRSASVWYCPWVDSGALRDSIYALASAVPVDALITLPSPIPNDDADTEEVSLPGPGAAGIDTATIVRRGEAPGFVEFADGPATVSSLVWADALATGDRCVVSVPKVWHLGGGTTADGFFLTLRLFNPFPENAKVTVNAASEFGPEPLPDLAGLDIAGRSWLSIDLTREIPFLDQVSFTVSTEQGLVIPSLVLADASDEASWPGTGLSTTWDFPITADGGLEPSLVISNTGTRDANISIDVFTPSGAVIDAVPEGVVAPAGLPVRIPLGDLAAAPFGVRVRSDVPVSVVVEARTPVPDDEAPPAEGEEGGDEVEAPVVPTGLAGTVGIVEPATRWLVPGIGLVPDTTSTIWIMNAGAEAATVTVIPVGPIEASAPDKVLIEPGSIAAVVVLESAVAGVEGYDLASDFPVSVAWSVRGERGVVLVSGVSVDE